LLEQTLWPAETSFESARAKKRFVLLGKALPAAEASM